MATYNEQQISVRDPAQPSYVFRGHTAQIHSVRIIRSNTCLVTGDADGYVVIWKLETKRPLLVWKAHDGAILGTSAWGANRLISHGRDHTLRIWQLDFLDTSTFSTVLPADGATTDRPKPWLLHSLPVNTLNFCALSMCHVKHVLANNVTSMSDSIVIAVPARDDKKVEVYQFPDEKLVYVVPKVGPKDTGMVMAVKLVHHQPSNNTVVAVGYEGGFIGIHLLPQDQTMRLQETRKQIQMTQIVYLSQPHTQPVLSLDASPDGTTYFTSSADAVIAAHRIPELPLVVHHQDSKYSKNSVSAGPYEETSAKPDQASATQRLPTPGLDSMPLLSADSDLNQTRSTFGQRNETSSEVGSADLLTFSKKHVVPINSATKSSASDVKPAGLSSLLSPATPLSKEKTSPFPIPDVTTPQQPYRVISSKHAGQQSLRVRSDGRLFVTGGWDSRIRIYSTKTLKEMAVLKWHKQGVYAVDFGEVLSADYLTNNQEKESGEDGVRDMPVVKKETGLGRLQRQREEQMQVKHWVAAGAKDGKVSLWEVF